MTIEVRQILIKASVTRRDGETPERVDSSRAYQAMKAEILEECRNLLVEILREERER